jgi:hypothetical protein
MSSASRKARATKATAKESAKARAKDESSSTKDGWGAGTEGEAPEWTKAVFLALALTSVLLLTLRLYATSVVGFGDSEALYASWALHPQPAYLDHPGLIGMIARAIGEGAVPTALRVHAVTSIAATLVPWCAFGTARALGLDRGRSAIAGLVVAVIPETAVGLFGLTPDLLLAPAWLGTIALAAIGMRSPPRENRSAAAFIAAGLLAGIACSAKVSGLLLLVALTATYAWVALSGVSSEGPSLEESPSPPLSLAQARSAVRTIWPWAGVAAGLVVLVPIVLYETKTGWPMVRHRFVETQTGAGVALRNVGALLGGQLVYLSPIFALFAILTARDLVRERSRDALSRLLFLAFAVPIVPLIALCLWSPVAEPHWIAPALLVLPLHAARRVGSGRIASRRGFLAAASLAAVLTLVAHAWVLVPSSARLLPASADPKLDIASELYGWPNVLEAVKEQMASAGTSFDPEGREVVVVGPDWTVCAQLHAGLPGVRVGCATPVHDDFDSWLPREEWRRAEHVLFVTDNRFPGDGAEQLPAHVRSGQGRVRIMRGGKTARIFELFMYDRRAQGSL